MEIFLEASGDRDREGLFAISVAAQLVSMEIQSLRAYEKHGLVSPSRTAGGTRLYSQHDVERLHRIRALLADGLNLAGIARVMELEDQRDGLETQKHRSAGEEEPPATTT